MSTDYAPNGQQAPPRIDSIRPNDQIPPDNHFGRGETDRCPWEWGNWILTAMRDYELACLEEEEKFRQQFGTRKRTVAEEALRPKPKHFSAWLAECVMANR